MNIKRPKAQIVHHTQNRLRLRIPEKRRDLAFFLNLYEWLRKIPGVTGVEANPTTGSALLHFHVGYGDAIAGVLARSDLLLVGGSAEQAGSIFNRSEGPAARVDRFLIEDGSSVANMRLILSLVMLGLTIQQLRRGQFLAPALTLFFYVVDLMFGAKREAIPVEEND